MKIGFDAKRATSNFTGLGNYSRFVISNLAQFYSHNRYILFSPQHKENKENIQAAKNVKLVVKQGLKLLWRTCGIIKDIRKEKIDIYHGLSNELPYNIHRTGVKSVVSIHDLIFLTHPQFYSFINRTIYTLKARYACQVADKIVAVSACTKRDIVAYYHINPAKIEVVYQGCFSIFGKRAASPQEKEHVRKKYELPTSYILSIGSIEERKNILLIVKALKQLPNNHFVAIGKQRKYASKVMQYAEENGLADRVHFRSNVALAHLPAILEMADVFVYPSLYEGFGIPIVEALSVGVPVIAATGSCLEEAGGEASIYVNPHNEDELAVQIKRVLTDDALRTQMVREGLEYVKGFSAEQCSRDMMAVYQALLK